MNDRPSVGFVCFGEVNTPFERLQIKHDEAKKELDAVAGIDLLDAGIVTDDTEYARADAAIAALKGRELDVLVLCVAGWIPTHAVIRVTDAFRNKPMILWGLCGWHERGKLITTADQAGTTAIRPAMAAMGYKFKYVYSVVDRPAPIASIESYIRAAYAARKLRSARIGTMGYRDMLLYGTQFEGNSMRGQLGPEVEPFEMLEMSRDAETLDAKEVADGVAFVKSSWVFEKPCGDDVIEHGVRYALAVGKRIRARKYDAVTLIDVDGMKKLLSFPPAMVFMLINHFYGTQVMPENDVMGNATQLMLRYLTGQQIQYLEYYEFFEKSMLIGVPDYIIEAVTDGDVHVLPAAFGLLSASLLNVSKVRTGSVTCARLVYANGKYGMHVYTADARRPAPWNECGWDDPAPQLPSLEVFPTSCTVPEFAQKVSSQHVLVAYGDCTEGLRDLCGLLGIEWL